MDTKELGIDIPLTKKFVEDSQHLLEGIKSKLANASEDERNALKEMFKPTVMVILDYVRFDIFSPLSRELISSILELRDSMTTNEKNILH
jgi:hypothetical protein